MKSLSSLQVPAEIRSVHGSVCILPAQAAGLSFASWPLCELSGHSERAGAAKGVVGQGKTPGHKQQEGEGLPEDSELRGGPKAPSSASPSTPPSTALFSQRCLRAGAAAGCVCQRLAAMAVLVPTGRLACFPPGRL